MITSTNVRLIIRPDVENNIIVIDEKHVEELRDLLNDYLESLKKSMPQNAPITCPQCRSECHVIEEDGTKLYHCLTCGCKDVFME